MLKKIKSKWLFAWALALISAPVLASSAMSLGSVASEIYSSFNQLANLITAGAYIGGLAFAVGAIMKFKQHKDNPTQVPIGTPISLVMIAAALLFLPSILSTTGQTIFGGGSTSGPTGSAWTTGGS